jgi:heat shock protein HslJ
MNTPARLMLLLVPLIALLGCAESDLNRESHPTILTGTAWRVVTVNGKPSVAGSEPTAIFAAGDVKGSAGCNSYGGRYLYDPSTGAIAFRDLGMTAMACLEPARNDFEALFSRAIVNAASASMDPEGRLVLSGPGSEIVLAVDAIPD